MTKEPGKYRALFTCILMYVYLTVIYFIRVHILHYQRKRKKSYSDSDSDEDTKPLVSVLICLDFLWILFKITTIKCVLNLEKLLEM